jgi:hypothetical protein
MNTPNGQAGLAATSKARRASAAAPATSSLLGFDNSAPSLKVLILTGHGETRAAFGVGCWTQAMSLETVQYRRTASRRLRAHRPSRVTATRIHWRRIHALTTVSAI